MNLKQLICAATLLIGTFNMFALAEREVNISEITVIGNQAQVASESLRIITALTQEQIAALPIQNLDELLDFLPGIDVRSRSGNSVQGDITMRGGTFDQVVILLNGVNITDAHTGHHNLNIPIDLSQIDRIEILQGTNMGIFGLSAFSGAINIITGTATNEKTAIKAAITAGQNGLFNPMLSAKFTNTKWTYSASGSYNQSLGYMHNTDYEYGNLFLQAKSKDTQSGNWNIQAGGQLKAFGANSFYSLKYPNQFEATKTLLGAVNWDKTFKQINIAASIYYRSHYDRFELIRAMVDAPTWYTGHNYHVTQTTGGNVKGSYFSSIGKTTAGIEVRNEQIYSNVLGDSIKQTKHIPFSQDSLLFLYAKNRLNLNYFVEQAFYLGNWAASLGVSGNYNSMFAHSFCWGANLGYHFLQNGSVYANVNKALRLPTYTDLYYKSATQLANPNLKPEESLTTELGAKWNQNHLQAQISGYYRIGKNIIDWIKAPEEEQWRSTNHTQVNAMGAEASLSYQHNYWLKNIGLSYSFCHLNQKQNEFLSKYALDYLKHKVSFALEHGIYKGFGASWKLSYQSREGSYTNATDQVENYTPFGLIDGRIYWQNSNINIFAEATNLTNQQYYDYGGILQPGRWIKAGIALKL